MSPFDIHDILAPSATLAEIVLRGTILYWFLFVMLRFILHRDTGSAGVPDILFVVLLVSETFYGRFKIFQPGNSGDRV